MARWAPAEPHTQQQQLQLWLSQRWLLSCRLQLVQPLLARHVDVALYLCLHLCVLQQAPAITGSLPVPLTS
jgi:hypothetical protein